MKTTKLSFILTSKVDQIFMRIGIRRNGSQTRQR